MRGLAVVVTMAMTMAMTTACGSSREPKPPPPPTPVIAPSPAAPQSTKPSLSTLVLVPPFHIGGVDIRLPVEQRLEHYDIPALGVAVVDHGDVESRAWGVREKGKPERVDVETRFQIASISKPVTAVAIMRLVEQGKLELDVDVARYLTSWKLPASPQPITLRRLLSHTAGIDAPEQLAYVKADGSLAGYAPGAPIPTTTQLLLGAKPAITTPITLAVPAPTGFSYSGGGYTIVQQILEDVTGKPFAEAMHDLVLGPAGMTHSTFDAAPGTDNVAHAHDAAHAPIEHGWFVVAEKAAGGLWTTPGDLGRLLDQLMAAANGERNALFAKPATMATMLAPIADAHPVNVGYIALGLFVPKPGAKGAPWFSHNGHNPGYHSTMVAAYTERKAVVVVTNVETDPGLALEALNGVGLAYQWPASMGMTPTEMTRVATSRDELAKCAGAYTGWGFHADIRVDGDKLLGKLGTAEEHELYAVGRYRFAEPYTGALLEFELEGQQVKSLHAKGMIGAHDAIRVP